MTQRKVALVTGASSGIGNAIARSLHRNGVQVYAGARRVSRMNDLDDLGITTLALDVTDPASVEHVVDRIVGETGRVDILVNNAGYGLMGALEDVPMDQAQAQFDVNLFGAARLIQSVLPMMRQQHSGRIINITSVDGKIAQPLASWYVASKFALEGLSDALRLELVPLGIDTVVIEPGRFSQNGLTLRLTIYVKRQRWGPINQQPSGPLRFYKRSSAFLVNHR